MSSSQEALAVLCSWEGIYKSGVRPVMRQSLWYTHLWDQWPNEGR